MEAKETARKVRKKQQRNAVGVATDPQQQAQEPADAQLEQVILDMPVFPYYQTQQQDPVTGKLYYMAGVGVLGVDPIAPGDHNTYDGPG